MSAFGDNFNQPEEDPAAEFLAREQDELAGLEDEVKPAAIVTPIFNGGKSVLVERKGRFSTYFICLYNIHKRTNIHCNFFILFVVLKCYLND